MDSNFFQVLRRIQKEENSKSSLARVDNDFYKQLRDYIKDLERSVANNPFGNEQLLLNNAQMIATEICQKRESKITQAANNNIFRSFLLFKKNNPQFDLLDTTPLNLTDEEETLYFSLMDVLKTHMYRISLDEYAEDSFISQDEEEEEEDFDEDEETVFVDDSYGESAKSFEEENDISDDLEDEISTALGEEDEVLDRLNQIKGAKVVTDEKHEHIDKQVANQMYPSQNAEIETKELESEQSSQVDAPKSNEAPQAEQGGSVNAQESDEGIKSDNEKGSRDETYSSGNVNDIFKDPDSQFVDLDKLEPNYDDDYFNSISAGSNYAAPSEDDFNMIFAKPKKPKSDESEKPGVKDGQSSEIESESKTSMEESESKPPVEESSPKMESAQADLGFSSGIDIKEGRLGNANGFNTIQKPKEVNAPKKPIDKTKGGLFSREEVENTTVVISEDIGEMVGIDGKVYGPFLENDVVILPNITAQILIENNKASLVKL